MGRLISAGLLLFLPLVCFSKIATELKSSVRIIEGVVAPDWEARFLPPVEPSAPVAVSHESPDADILKEPSQPVVKKGRIVVAPVKDISRHKPLQPSLGGVSPEPLPEKEDVPRHRVEEKVASQPAPPHRERTPQTASAPSSKIDKEEETGDDSVEKRKKERRDTLREERKDRNYRNRRIE